MFRVKAVFKVNLRFANQIIATEQVPIEYLYGQLRVHGEGGLDVEALAEHGIELLGDVIVLVVDHVIAKHDFQVGIGLAIRVHWMQIICLYNVDADEHVNWII